MLTTILTFPWFWAFLATVGWRAGFGIFDKKTLVRCLRFGIAEFILSEHPHLLPLRFVSQPRLELTYTFFNVAGVVVFVGSLFFGILVFRNVPLTRPDHHESLQNEELSSIVRHPLMLFDIFWLLGWSLTFGLVIDILLTPI